MKSIMQKADDEQCFLCAMEGRTGKAIHWHHIFHGTSNRKLSEKYGLKVRLCLHHHTGDMDGNKEAVHFNKEVDMHLKKMGQQVFERRYPELDFRAIFGKNYLEEDEHPHEAKKGEGGFILLE